jgi:hypothetical protein
MINSLNLQKKDGLVIRPNKSQIKLGVEDPSLISQYLNEKQMKIFLQGLMKKI